MRLSPRASVSKYGNKKVKIGSLTLDSEREADAWRNLTILNSRGVIRGLTRQVRFPLVVNGVKVTTYVADFVFVEDGAQVIADAKGYRTREYLMKKRLLKAIHGYDIREL